MYPTIFNTGFTKYIAVLILPVKKKNGDIGAGAGENVGWHGDHAAQHPFLDQIFPNFLRNTRSGCQKTGRHNNGRFPFRGKGINNVLNEQQIDCHSNVYSIWNPWRNYFESMDISTNIYVADSSTSFEWTKTIYGWA